jgi:hypothetical protein
MKSYLLVIEFSGFSFSAFTFFLHGSLILIFRFSPVYHQQRNECNNDDGCYYNIHLAAYVQRSNLFNIITVFLSLRS